MNIFDSDDDAATGSKPSSSRPTAPPKDAQRGFVAALFDVGAADGEAAAYDVNELTMELERVFSDGVCGKEVQELKELVDLVGEADAIDDDDRKVADLAESDFGDMFGDVEGDGEPPLPAPPAGPPVVPPSEPPAPRTPLAEPLAEERAPQTSAEVAQSLGMAESSAPRSSTGTLYELLDDTGTPTGLRIGALHFVFGTSFKATCRLHDGCTLFVSAVGRNAEVRDMCLAWIAAGPRQARGRHVAESDAVKAKCAALRRSRLPKG